LQIMICSASIEIAAIRLNKDGVRFFRRTKRKLCR
jgi:hypothetical protein